MPELARSPEAQAPSHLAVLYAAVAEAAHRGRAGSIDLIDFGKSAGSNFHLDEVAIRYGSGQILGDPSSGFLVTSRVAGERPLPTRGLPRVDGKRAAKSLDELSAALDRVSDGVLPMVTTTWALSRYSLEDRLRFLNVLTDAGDHRPVGWASIEGVGVAPGISTLGDRRASGHSIVGVALFDRRGVRAEAVGRCWSRGRVVDWVMGT